MLHVSFGMSWGRSSNVRRNHEHTHGTTERSPGRIRKDHVSISVHPKQHKVADTQSGGVKKFWLVKKAYSDEQSHRAEKERDAYRYLFQYKDADKFVALYVDRVGSEPHDRNAIFVACFDATLSLMNLKWTTWNNTASDEERMNIVRHLQSAMDFLHAHDFVHGDIKPENVVINISMLPQLTPRFIDMEEARFGKGDTNSALCTVVGDLRGTLGYIYPPHAVDVLNALSHRDELHTKTPVTYSDRFGLGCVAFEIFMRRRMQGIVCTMTASKKERIDRLEEFITTAPNRTPDTVDAYLIAVREDQTVLSDDAKTCMNNLLKL